MRSCSSQSFVGADQDAAAVGLATALYFVIRVHFLNAICLLSSELNHVCRNTRKERISI